MDRERLTNLTNLGQIYEMILIYDVMKEKPYDATFYTGGGCKRVVGPQRAWISRRSL